MKTILCGVLLTLAAGASLAQTKLSPGLWEHSTRMKSGSGEMEAAMARMQEQLAAMPPEQRKQMEQAMARQGMSVAPGASGGQAGMAFKVCLTPDKAARDEVPLQESSCKQTGSSRHGNTVKFRFECAEPRKASGEGEVTYVSSKEHRGKLKLTASRGAREETMEMETSARWLGADCGEVKPRP